MPKVSAAAPADSELADARAQQAAVNEILRVIDRARDDAQPVFETIARSALNLCGARLANVFTYDGQLLHLAAIVNVNPEYFSAIHDVFPRRPGRDTAAGRAVQTRDVVVIEDVLADADYGIKAPSTTGGYRRILAVPLMRDGDAIGAIIVGASEPGSFPDSQIALLQTFAAQAVIAIENVRLFDALNARNAALTESLEQQTATSDILRAISRARDDVQPVFDTMAHSSMTLCGASSSVVVTLDAGLLHIRGLASTTREGADALHVGFPRPPSRDNGATRAVFHREVVVIPDILEDPDYGTTEMALDAGFRSVLAVPLMRESEPIGAISVGREVPGPFPASHVELLQTFAAQAVIAIENVRLFNELGQRNAALSESLEQRVATSEILAIISRSPTDVQPVFDTIAENALRLCEGIFSAVYRFDGELIHLGALRNITPEGDAAFHRIYPCPPGKNGTTQRAILTGQMIHMPDIRLVDDYGYHDIAAAAGFRSVLAIPMLHEGSPIGAVTVYRDVAAAFPEEKIALLRTFADQAVIAVQNVRLFNELDARNAALTESLEQQTATSDILRVISQSPTDVQPVFETIAKAALELCSAVSVNVFTFDGELVHLGAFLNANPAYGEELKRMFPARLSRDYAVTRAIMDGCMVQIPDVYADTHYALGTHSSIGGFRSNLAVPLVREGRPVGAIVVGRPDPGEFPHNQIELLKTFADQAVIAIENVRMFNELGVRNRDLSEALEHQTATSDILRVISQSRTDVQPVFDTIAEAALKLCAAASALVTRVEGDVVTIVASANLTEEGAAAMREAFPRPVSRSSTSTRAVFEGRMVAIPDVLADPDYEVQEQALRAAFRSTLAVPLMRDGRPIGTITVGKPEPGPFSDSQITLLQTFAEQAVIAVENVRLFNELGVRNRDLSEALEQQTATSDILRVISQSQTNVQPVFDTIVRSVKALCDATFSGVYLLEGDTIALAATAGMTELAATVFAKGYPRRIGTDTVSGRAALECRVVQTPDLLSDPDYAGAPGTFVGARTVLGVPLLREGRAIGSIGVWRDRVQPFTDTQIALLETFADQAVIAIENVRLFNELNARTDELTRSIGELRALGEVGRAVSSTLDVETVLGTIVQRVTQLTGMDGGSIYEYDEGRSEFHLHSANGLPPDVVEALHASPIRKGEGALGRLATTGQVVEIGDVADQRVYQSRVRNALVRIGYRAMLVVPLLQKGRLLGGLVLNRRAPGAFDPQVVELVKTFATQSAIAIQNARLFREIEIKSRELETASRHKSEFLANMSHELRTPLNAIIGFSEVLGERLFGELNEKQSEYVSDIADSGRHLLELINDILDLSKIEAGRMELDASDVDLPKAIAQTLSLVRERAERRSIALSSAIDDTVGAVHADARKVKQVLLNLLSNALKFTPEGGRIDVRAVAFDDRVEVSVADTGVGIAPEDQDAVFEEFRQVGASSARAEGTGLGLAISRKFIELHGGRMWLASMVGKGSTFTFSLPLRGSAAAC